MSVRNTAKRGKEFFSRLNIKKRYTIYVLSLLVLAIFLEAFLFNYKWLGSIALEPIHASYKVDGLDDNSDDYYLGEGKDAYIEINDINQQVKYISLDIKVEGEDTIGFTISAKDEANGKWLASPQRTLTHEVKRSKYVRLHYSGDVSDIRIQFKPASGKKVEISNIYLNPNVPLMFSFGRMIFVWVFMLLILFLRPKSFLYKKELSFKENWQKAVLLALIVAIAAGFYPIAKMDPWCDRDLPETRQYQKLAEALEQGTVSIGEEKDSKMLNLENPYDTQVRGKLGKWDNAYYNGKYYVYFGIAPVLMYYLPYHLLTGKPLKNSTAVYISCTLAAIGILFLLYRIAKKKFKSISFGVYLLISITTIIGCGIIYTLKRPDMYPLPIITACMFSLFGLGFWISSRREDETGEIHLSRAFLALGSFFMAAVAASRPQMLLASLFAVPIFWDDVIKDRRLFSKKGIIETIVVCLPYLVIGLAVMAYNYARFSSPFDFGANYNLTSNDMTKRGFELGRVGLGIFTYLFQMPHTKAVFPFINVINVDTAYQGLTIYEKFFGGVMMTEPILWVGVFGMFNKKLFKDKRTYAMVCLAFIISIVLVIVDTQMAGLLRRYFGDFLWIMYLGAGISSYAIYEKLSEKENKKHIDIFIKILLACLIIAIVFHGLEIFVDGAGWGIVNTNKVLYQKLQYLIAFWM